MLPHVENRSKEQRKTFNDQTTLTITLTVSVTRVNFACHSHSLTSCTKSSSQRKDCYDRIEKKASVNKSRLTQLSEINVKGRKCSTFIKLRFYLKIAMPWKYFSTRCEKSENILDVWFCYCFFSMPWVYLYSSSHVCVIMTRSKSKQLFFHICFSHFFVHY